MADIQPTTLSPAASVASAPSSGLTAVPVTISSVSQALDTLTRSIQTNATPTTVQGNMLTLVTALGNVTVTLAQQVSKAEQQVLLQQLMTFVQTQRPLTLALQPGSPPTQGTLLIQLPPAPATAALPPAPAPAVVVPPLQNVPLPPLTVGETVSAIVLPSSSPPPPPNLPLANPPPATQAPLAPPPALPPAPQQPLPAIVQSSLQAPTPIQQPTVAPPNPQQPQSTSAPIPPPPPLPAPSILPETTASSTPLSAASLTTSPPPVQSAQSAPPIPAAAPQPPSPIGAPPLPLSPQLHTLLQSGNEVLLHVDTALPPEMQAKQPLPPLAPNQIVATVSGFGSNGQLLLKAGDTTLFVKAQAGATLGTQLVVTVEAAKPAPLLPLPVHEAANFPALPQVMAALAQLDPQIAQQLMSTRLPQPTAALPGALLFLFSAFKQGDVRGWLGNEATDHLMRAEKMEILKSLSQELSGAGQPAQDAVVGEWKSYPLPLYAQQQFQALTLYVHHEQDGQKGQTGGNGADKGKVRFLIDMKLSKLGSMQIDGFVQSKKLDMILRSETTLPAGLPNDLRCAYIKAVEAVGYAGSLHFQVGRKHWMMMQQAAPPPIRA